MAVTTLPMPDSDHPDLFEEYQFNLSEWCRGAVFSCVMYIHCNTLILSDWPTLPQDWVKIYEKLTEKKRGDSIARTSMFEGSSIGIYPRWWWSYRHWKGSSITLLQPGALKGECERHYLTFESLYGPRLVRRILQISIDTMQLTFIIIISIIEEVHSEISSNFDSVILV